MEKKELRARSKFLSYLLRHKPETLQLTMDPQGWVTIDEIIDKSEHPITRSQIEEIVVSNSKQRFAISADGKKIRANQGHSIPIDLGLPECRPPEMLFHGTAASNIEAIRTEGLTRQNRHHVHLSSDAQTARQVGMRHGKPVVLVVEAGQMHASGHVFLLSENGVWLCDQVPPLFLRP
ncbi:RNA 2'-phosphotransferase [Parasedimentitalea huanghaiensis]|uniref:Probable RNA 2'-phosphotransferase n=1 Tax=Parasedimentitalea huanghaiensis TaxID=2682100 RepID=A0A6L6WMK8_9RHOB|nr:RNA 2'-phosphotransferase [Zongyanglinia huanghaiensis]MVO16872.1 RNA 2'-phosphotransferase [Zongyanglinia huanghaiensis]